jgi:GMP synthase (glutamine-hydrolysing)
MRRVRALVLQHIACEPPASTRTSYASAERRSIASSSTRASPFPVGESSDVIVAMGGPDERERRDRESLPRRREVADRRGGSSGRSLLRRLPRSTAPRRKPRRRVYPGAEPEVGPLPVSLADAAVGDPLFAGLPREVITFQWHADAFDLPSGAELLATSSLNPYQVFRWGSRAYGVQFHLEVSSEIAKEWADVPAYSEALERMLGPGSLAKLIEEFRPRADELRAHGRQIFERWLDLRGAPRRRNACDGAVDTVDTSAERAVHRVD